MRQQILEQMPTDAPSFFFVDIQNDQMDRFRAWSTRSPAWRKCKEVPSLRARVVAVKGVPVEQADVTPDTAWALQGDRGLTYAATPPEGTQLVAGTWWPPDYDGPPLVSFDAGHGQGLACRYRRRHPGQRARPRHRPDGSPACATSPGSRLSINFFMVASPGLLSHAPHTHIATVRVDPAQRRPCCAR